MSRWFRLYDEFLDDPKIQRLHPDDFRKEFLAAIAGNSSAFSDYIDGPFSRPSIAEWKALRAAVFARDDYTCQYCGARAVSLECDHAVPVSRGGSSELGNLKTSCRPCNRRKATKTVEEFVHEQ